MNKQTCNKRTIISRTSSSLLLTRLFSISSARVAACSMRFRVRAPLLRICSRYSSTSLTMKPSWARLEAGICWTSQERKVRWSTRD